MPIESDSDEDAQDHTYNSNELKQTNFTQKIDNYKTQNDTVDHKYICPITKQLMKTPVIAYDNHIYMKKRQ